MKKWQKQAIVGGRLKKWVTDQDFFFNSSVAVFMLCVYEHSLCVTQYLVIGLSSFAKWRILKWHLLNKKSGTSSHRGWQTEKMGARSSHLLDCALLTAAWTLMLSWLQIFINWFPFAKWWDYTKIILKVTDRGDRPMCHRNRD